MKSMQEDKMRVYLSGPITGTADVERRFKEAAKRIRDMGHIPVNPYYVDKALPGGTHSEYMAIDTILLDLSDAIYMMAGWKKSRGARCEYIHAKTRGHEIIFEEAEE